MVSKYGHLIISEAFPDKDSYLLCWFYRWRNSSVLCSGCKNNFVGTGDLQVIINKLCCENLWGMLFTISGCSFVYIYFQLFKKSKYITLGADYMKKSYSVDKAGLCTKTHSLVIHEIFTSPDRWWTFRDKLWIQVKATDHLGIFGILNSFWYLSKHTSLLYK